MSSSESILRGEDAALSNLRGALLQSAAADAPPGTCSSSAVQDAALEQRLDASEQERVLHTITAVTCSLTGHEHGDDDFTAVTGSCIVTSQQVWFVADSQKDAQYDTAVDAAAIDLHAVQAEPSFQLYIQLHAATDEDVLLEWTLQPATEATTQSLFDALTDLVSLHPANDAADDDYMMNAATGGGGGAEGLMGEWMGADGPMSAQQAMEMMNGAGAANGAGGDDERQAMLERLGDMLVVPDDLVIADDAGEEVQGQFDDAEDDAIL